MSVGIAGGKLAFDKTASNGYRITVASLGSDNHALLKATPPDRNRLANVLTFSDTDVALKIADLMYEDWNK